MSGACQRIVEYNGMRKKEKCNENLIKSQFVIMSSHNDLLSSDESVISVGNYVNPFGDIKVNNIPMEIVEDLHIAEDDSVRVCSSKVVKPADKVFFWLVQHLERILAGSRLYIKIHFDDRNVMFNGMGREFVRHPVYTITASGDGSCLFNSISLFLTGKEYYSATICHVICNYISCEDNKDSLVLQISNKYRNGKEYIECSGMRSQNVWATDVEIYALAQITKYDVYVYRSHNNWLHYNSNVSKEKTKFGFSFNNASGDHFDLVFTMKRY